MRLSFTILLILSTLSVKSHDVRIAYFEISEQTNGYRMVVRFDRHDVLKELGTFSDLGTATEQYLRSHASFLFNGRKVLWEVNNVELKELFIVVDCTYKTNIKTINTINIWNTCLIASVEKHSNIVISKLNGRSRSFRLSKNREQTTIKY